MARIELAPEIVEDFDRILEHLAEHESQNGPARIQGIIAAIDVLEHNPLIGRATASENRKLVIGQGPRGYIALYRYIAGIDTVLVLAVRNQREAGYTRGPDCIG